MTGLILNPQRCNNVGKNKSTLPYQGSALPLSYLGHFKRSHNNIKLTPLVHIGLGAFFINGPKVDFSVSSIPNSYGSNCPDFGATSFRGPTCGLGYLKARVVLVPYQSGHYSKKDQGLRVSAVPHFNKPRCLLTRKKAGGKFPSLNKKSYESVSTLLSGRGTVPQVQRTLRGVEGLKGVLTAMSSEGTKALSSNGSLRE